jgi:phosphoglycerate kinase
MNMSPGDIGVDIGPRAILHFEEKIIPAKTVFWNGPMGLFEIEKFSRGTFEIARYLAELRTFTVVGGGESATVVQMLDLADKFEHVSTGGGATLKFIEGHDMPALDVLDDIKTD